jgi:hypothetical protein
LSYGSDHWIGFIDVLFCSLRNFHSSGDAQLQEIRHRYSTWSGFALIDPHFKPEMEHEIRRVVYFEKLILFLTLVQNTYNLQFYVTTGGQIGVVLPTLNAQVRDMVYIYLEKAHPIFWGGIENIIDLYVLLTDMD